MMQQYPLPSSGPTTASGHLDLRPVRATSAASRTKVARRSSDSGWRKRSLLLGRIAWEGGKGEMAACEQLQFLWFNACCCNCWQ